MNYGKFNGDALVVRPAVLLIVDGKVIWKPTDEQMKAAGYLPLEDAEAPAVEDGYIRRSRWVQTEEAIVKKWTVLPDTRPLSQSDITKRLIIQQINELTVDDNTALRMKAFYPKFENLIGQTVKQGFRFNYGGKLWSVIQPSLTITEVYAPGEGMESLYTEVCESHAGTMADPIPYSGNMALESGKYYVQDFIIYLCDRDTGKPVYHALSELVGLYVEAVW